jgi:hypothetical protein
MSKTKKTLATALVALVAAAAPVASLALTNSPNGVHLTCAGGGGTGGCFG